MLLICVLVRLKPGLAPIMTQRASLSEKLTSLRGCWAVGLLAIVVIVGMYTGAVSPSSAGTVGACGALIIGLLRRKLSFTNIRESLVEAAQLSAVVFLIIIGGLLLDRKRTRLNSSH